MIRRKDELETKKREIYFDCEFCAMRCKLLDQSTILLIISLRNFFSHSYRNYHSTLKAGQSAVSIHTPYPESLVWQGQYGTQYSWNHALGISRQVTTT